MAGERERVLAQIDNDELIDLCSSLARFPSYSDQERECAEWLGSYMADHGLEVELQEVEPGRPNVLGRLRGDGSGASLMFNGHLDIDPVPREISHDPWKIEVRDGKLWGLGIRNMKGGVASMVHAAIAVKRSGIPLKGDLVVAGVVGELQAGVGTQHLVKTGVLTDLALIPEPTNMNVRTMHSCVFTTLIRVRGKSGWHGSMHGYRTVNAVEKMARLVLALQDLRFTYTPNPEMPGLPRYLIGTIIGGLGDGLNLKRASYVPDTCVITLEMRILPEMTPEAAMADVERVLQRARDADPDLEVEQLPPPAAYAEPWRALAVVMPGLNLPTDHPLARLVVRAHREIVGRDPDRVGAEDPGSYAGTDAGHLFAAGVKCLIFGPAVHRWGESAVELDKFFAHCRIYAACAAEILSTERARWLR